MRRVQVFNAAPSFASGGKWEDVDDLGRLEEGDRIRMFEPSGEDVIAENGSREWTVTRTPFVAVRLETTIEIRP